MTSAKVQHELAQVPSFPAEPLAAPNVAPAGPRKRRPLFRRFEAFVSRLSTRNNFWHKVCSLIWLPYAFRSGISMKRLGTNRFRAVLPFKRINRN